MTRNVRSSLLVVVIGCASTLAWSGIAAAQPDKAQPDKAQPDKAGAPEPDPEPELETADSSLTIHVITTRNTYESMAFDIFDASTEGVVASGTSVDETTGQAASTFQLPPGVYKIVRSGEPFATRVDFATVIVDGATDYVIVVDPRTGAFRGSGVVTGELPEGREIAGIRIALNVGGSLAFNQQENIVGTTNGINVLVGLFGNFSMVMSRDSHFLKVDSQLQLMVRDPETAGAFSTNDLFRGSALYAYNLDNPYIGPYGRVSFQTKVFPGYLYLEEETMASGVVNIARLDGSVDTITFGDQANSDDLRIKVAEAFAPLIIQEEVGANLKAVDIDLKLLKLNVATRVGFGFRQGIANQLLVVDGSERGTPINLREVDDYSTLGPVAGATATVTVARWLFGSGELGLLAPLMNTDDAGDGFGERLLLDLSATGGLKFPSISFLYGSIDYTLRLQRDGYLTSDTQFAHSVMARANLQLF